MEKSYTVRFLPIRFERHKLSDILNEIKKILVSTVNLDSPWIHMPFKGILFDPSKRKNLLNLLLTSITDLQQKFPPEIFNNLGDLNKLCEVLYKNKNRRSIDDIRLLLDVIYFRINYHALKILKYYRIMLADASENSVGILSFYRSLLKVFYLIVYLTCKMFRDFISEIFSPSDDYEKFWIK